MKKILLLLSCVFLMTNASIVYGAATVKMIDFMVSHSGFTELMYKNGFKEVDVKQVENYVFTSLNSLGSGKNLTQKELSDLLVKLPVTGDDANIRKELQVLLDKSESTIKKEDIVKVVNNIILLSNRYGKSIIITCADCVSESLAKSGFKFTVENIKNAGSVKLLADVIPSNPKDLNKFITSKAKRLGFGDYSKVSSTFIAPEEEKSLALFLALAESGSAAHKEFASVVRELSTDSKKVANLFSTTNPNKLWKIITTDVSDEQVIRMTTLLKEVNVVMSQDPKTTMKIEEAFNQVLKKRAESSDELFLKFKNIKSKRCFFK